MINSIKKDEAITCLFIGLLSTLIPSFIFSVWDGLFVAIILFFFIRLFFKKYDRLLFTFSFGLFLLNSTIFLLILNFVNGSPYLTGGDDFLFYSAGKELYKTGFDINIEVDGVPLWASNYPAYLFLISFYYKFLSFFGLNSLHFYHLTLFKISIGAIIPVLVNKVCDLISFGLSKLTFIVIIMLPTLVYHTTTFLRESIISFFFVFGVFIILSNKPNVFKLLLILITTTILYFIRPIHSIFFIIFSALYFIFNRKNAFGIKFYILIIFFIIGYFIFDINNSELFIQYQNTQNSYFELTQLTSQEGSLGVKLYGSNNILMWPIKYLYYLMSPIPPPIVGTLNLLTIFISIGSILWYLIVLGFLKSGLRKTNRLNPFFLTLFILFLIAGAVGVNTTKDPRHLIFIFPLIIPFGLRELKTIPRYVLYLLLILILIIGILSYILMKFTN